MSPSVYKAINRLALSYTQLLCMCVCNKNNGYTWCSIRSAAPGHVLVPQLRQPGNLRFTDCHYYYNLQGGPKTGLFFESLKLPYMLT